MAQGSGDDGQEKAYDATPRKLEQARSKGDAPKSQDAQTLAAYVGLAVAVALAGQWSVVTFGESLRPLIAEPVALGQALFGSGPGAVLPDIAARASAAVLPVIALPAVLIVVLLIVQRAFVLAPDKLSPKVSRISPVSNAGQKYGPTGLFEFAKSVLKLTAVSGVLAVVAVSEMGRIAGASHVSPRLVGGLLGELFDAIIIGLLVVAGGIALFDVLWQQADFARRNRMSHQELKEEGKQAEGDPHFKAARTARAREIANNRMMADVPKADVVIVNPQHYAVALKWSRTAGGAPTCLAKGIDEIAHRIREAAEEAGVPVHRDPPTARSLHALVEVGEEIRPEHYKAVAAAILFAEKARAKARRAVP